MSRVLLQYVLPLLLPTLLYLAWWSVFGRRGGAGGGPPPRLTEGPWFWLIISGAGLMVGGFIYTGLTTGEAPGGRYVAPQLQHGRVVPGHVERN